jgi:hypothetical protein
MPYLWRKPLMELGLYVARFLKKKSKMTFQSFKKFETKNLDVHNYGIYYYAKNQSEIHYILGSAKMTNP